MGREKEEDRCSIVHDPKPSSKSSVFGRKKPSQSNRHATIAEGKKKKEAEKGILI